MDYLVVYEHDNKTKEVHVADYRDIMDALIGSYQSLAIYYGDGDRSNYEIISIKRV